MVNTTLNFNGTIIEGDPTWAAGILLGYLLLGLLIVIWAFFSQRSRLKAFKESMILSFTCQQSRLQAVQTIHDCLSALLLMDVLNSITAIILMIQLSTVYCDITGTCMYVFIIWFLTKCFMGGFHLLCALEGILFLHNPQSGKKLQLTARLAALFLLLFIPFYAFSVPVAIFGEMLVNFGLILAMILTAMRPAAVAGKMPILFVAMFTFLFTYIPKLVFQLMMEESSNFWNPTVDNLSVYVKVLLFTNVQLIMDGFLCSLILKLPFGEEQQQQNPSSNVFIYSVSH